MGTKDIGSKRIIDYDPEGWVTWLLDDSSAELINLLNAEFQFVQRRSDALLEVKSEQHGHFIILIEIQMAYDTDMPARIQSYCALAREKYGLPIWPCVIYLAPLANEAKLMTEYHSTFMGLVTHQDFRVVKLWEYPATIAFSPETPLGIIPFIPLMAGMNESILRACAERIRQETDDSAKELETILNLFARMKMDAALVEKILRLSMTVLEKTPIYQEILQRGLDIGTHNGIEQGIKQGEKALIQSKIDHVLLTFTWRFGTVPDDVVARLNQLNLEQLDMMINAAFESAERNTFLTTLDTLG